MTAATEGRLPFRCVLEVRFGDADALGHVNNVIYYRYLEQARVRFMQTIWGGLTGNAMADFPYVVAHSELDFLAPLHYDDHCLVTMGISRLGHTSFTFCYELFSVGTQTMVARGTVVMVVVDHQIGRPQPIPDELRQAYQPYLTN